MSSDDFDWDTPKRRRKKADDDFGVFGKPQKEKLPQCAWCGKGARNPLKCTKCSGWFTTVILCCERCAKAHVNARHPEATQHAGGVAGEPKADAVLVELKKLNQLKQQELDAAVSKKQRLEYLREAINRATKLVEDRLHAWQQAGSPEIPQTELDMAQADANRLRTLVKEANRGRRIASVKIAYLRLARFTRKMAGQPADTDDDQNMPWVVPALIGGVVVFAFISLFALPFSKSLVLTLAIGGVGFLCGFFGMMGLLFFPENKAVREGIASLEQQKSDQLEPLGAANLAYEEAQRRYDNLAGLHKLRSEYETALAQRQQLEEEYQATLAV